MDITEMEDEFLLAEKQINPFAAKTLQDFIMITTLMTMHDNNCLVSDLQYDLFQGDNFLFIKRKFGCQLTAEDIREAFREMHRRSWIKPAQYKCECCKDKKDIKDILSHATAFKITAMGKEQIS